MLRRILNLFRRPLALWRALTGGHRCRVMNYNNRLKVITGRANPQLAERIALQMGDGLGKVMMQNFPDGEFLARIDEDVRGRDVFVVQPTCPPVNESLMELLITLDALKRASAARVTAVLP